MSGRTFSRSFVAVVIAAAASAAALTACGTSIASTDHGCDQTVLGVAGVIRPESSGMTCQQIRQMNSGVSPGGGPYFVESPFTGRLWKCRTRGPHPKAPLLRCELDTRSFSIVTVRGR